MLNLETLKWQNVSYDAKGFKGIAYHAAVSVFRGEV
jgi:hypothetical protein